MFVMMIMSRFYDGDPSDWTKPQMLLLALLRQSTLNQSISNQSQIKHPINQST